MLVENPQQQIMILAHNKSILKYLSYKLSRKQVKYRSQFFLDKTDEVK
jgi:hypothetical protein